MSESSKSSPVASSWTRQPPKPITKKKKKLIAGRELRERGARKVYAESSTSDYEEEEEEADLGGGEPDAEDHLALEQEEEEEEEKPRTKKITLRISSSLLRQARETAGESTANGVAEEMDEEQKKIVVDAEVDDLQAEVEDLKETVLIDEQEDDDDDEGPRRLTRRVTRQSSLSKPAEAPERPSHGRKGVARQTRSSEKTNGNGVSPQDGNRRSSMRHRLREEARRRSRKDKKKRANVSESEFEDDDDEAEDDDISAESEGNAAVENDSEESYSSAPRRKRTKKPPPSRGKRRSRHVSDEDSLEEDNDGLLEELREIGAEIPQRQRQLRPTERMNYFIPPPPDKDDIILPPPGSAKKRTGAGRGFGGFGGFGGDFSGMGLSDRFRGITGLGTAGGADDSSDSVSYFSLLFSYSG